VTGRPGPDDTYAAEAAEKIRAATDMVPRAAIVLGSGLAPAVRGLEAAFEFPYSDLPGFPEPSVPGHVGRLVLGTLGGVPVAVFMGRIHHYEGHPMSVVTLPTRLTAELGASALVATASVGGLDPGLSTGTLVVGSDHVGFMDESPLRGWRRPDGTPAFFQAAGAYDEALAAAALAAAADAGLPAVRGIYVALTGPAYETPAEIELYRRVGGTVVGMSVAPEAEAASALGLRFLGLYFVTNIAGLGTTHEDVETAGARFAPRLGEVLREILDRIERSEDGL
jgi:purine-nucleoside phosphorylase